MTNDSHSITLIAKVIAIESGQEFYDGIERITIVFPSTGAKSYISKIPNPGFLLNDELIICIHNNSVDRRLFDSGITSKKEK